MNWQAMPLYMAWCDAKAAQFACRSWHYTKALPVNSPVRIGVWELGEFVGVVAYGNGGGGATNGRSYGLARSGEMAELSRVALRPNHDTSTSKIVARSIRMVAKANPRLQMLISFADWMGQGHAGTIYQATNWVYTGDYKGDNGWVVQGRRWHSRSLHDKGWRSSEDWLKQHVDPNAKQLCGRKHRYLYPLNDEVKRRIQPLAKPYPKRATSDTSDTLSDHEREGGAAPTVALAEA